MKQTLFASCMFVGMIRQQRHVSVGRSRDHTSTQLAHIAAVDLTPFSHLLASFVLTMCESCIGHMVADSFKIIKK